MIPLIGFAPDADPTTPGVITGCQAFIPMESGFRGAPSPVSIGAAALTAACVGAVGVSNLTGSRRLFAGTATGIYELSSNAWADVSRGAAYALDASDRWSFIQYANSTLAATPTAVIQRSTSGDFADVAGSPQAKLIEASQGFAVAFNTSTSPDEWYCSAYLDDTNWTLSLATQCVKGRLIGGSGPINAVRRFGQDIVAYKQGTIFVGSYVGAPEVWRWVQVSNDVGCVGQDAVVDTAIGHIFVGRDNVYLWDGTTPRPLATGVLRKWLFDDMSSTYRSKVLCLWDRATHLVWIYYPSSSSTGEIDHCVVYHVLTKQWGVADGTVEASVTFASPEVTYAGGVPGVSTYDASPPIPYSSTFWVSDTTSPAVFTTSHVLSTLSGECVASSFTTGDMGEDGGYTKCTALRVRYSIDPTTSNATGYVKDAAGSISIGTSSGIMHDGRHDLMQRARWHRFRVETTGNYQVTAVEPQLQPAGTR